MVMPKEYAPISLSIESITVRAGKYVLMEVDDNSMLIVHDVQGILVQQLRKTPVQFLNIYY